MKNTLLIALSAMAVGASAQTVKKDFSGYTLKKDGQAILLQLPLPTSYYSEYGQSGMKIRDKKVQIQSTLKDGFITDADSTNPSAESILSNYIVKDVPPGTTAEELYSREMEFRQTENNETIALWHDAAKTSIYPKQIKAAKIVGNSIVQLTLTEPLSQTGEMKTMLADILDKALVQK